MRALIPAIVLIAVIVGLFYWSRSNSPVYQQLNPNNSSSSSAESSDSATPSQGAVKDYVATIELDKGGIIHLQLFPQIAPKTVANFIQKANSGYYDSLIFHRVEGWVVQGGDPTGNGTGGNNNLTTELSKQPFKVGALGVARGGDIKVSNDSQFFITKQDSDFLDGQYTNFGQIIDGMDVVNKIQIGDKIRHIRVQ